MQIYNINLDYPLFPFPVMLIESYNKQKTH